MNTVSTAVSAPSPVPAGPGAAELETYFIRLHAAFAQARAATPSPPAQVFGLAGHAVRLQFAGHPLMSVLTAALVHLPAAELARGLDIYCWDGASTGLIPPAPPWPWPAQWPPSGFIAPFGNDAVRVAIAPDSGAITLYRADTRQAFFWTPDAAQLPTYHHGSPLLSLFSWWSQGAGLGLVHAACIGNSRGAVLLAGKGGSGKSTAALLCAEAGLSYLSDDYCLVRTAPTPTAFSLYSSGKLHRAHLALFPRLAALALDPCTDQFAKPVILLGREPRYKIARELPLRAVVVPVITRGSATSFEPASSAAALRALAPSTLLQLGNANPESFQALAALVRKLPAFRLNLGPDFAAIAPAVRSLLDEVT